MADLTDFTLTDLVDDHEAGDINILRGGVLKAQYVNTETITATKELADSDCQMQVITPSGANQTVELPPEATTNHVHFIKCAVGASYDVLVKDDSGATTYCILDASQWALCIPAGSAWHVMYSGYLPLSYVAASDILSRIPVSGMMLNGKISPSVSSNDLVLTLLTLAGAAPSATDPVYININGTVRTVTAATSCTLADGTNWFNAGSAELATKEIDYFAYAIWDSNSSVVAIAPARISHGRLVSDFSATTTNEKYLGNYANYTTTDDVCVIGRFAATLSAGAGYTWTVPTFTGSNLILFPIFKTRWLTWVPTLTGFSADPADTAYRYRVEENVVRFMFSQQTNGTSNATGFTATLPMAIATVTNGVWHALCGSAVDNGSVLTSPARATLNSAGTTITFYKDAATGAWTNANGKRAVVSAWYEI